MTAVAGTLTRLKDSLRDTTVYQRLRASRLYDLSWRIFDPRILESRDREIAFYAALLHGMRPGDVVFDIGANIGYKADMFLRLGARVVAVDPDPVNARRLSQQFLDLRVRKRQVTIVEAAVSDRVSTVTLWVDAPGSAKNTLSDKWANLLRHDADRFGSPLDFGGRREVAATTLDALIHQRGRPYFVKIDVEGHELQVLSGLSIPVPVLSFEVNLPEFRSEGIQCVERLATLDVDTEFNFAADLTSGFLYAEWGGAAWAVQALEDCSRPSIEVFARSPNASLPRLA
jgi:FkbM family methyltransferase